jgi:quinol-cytochrome oxidoreductase complex cytochrome b subunit
MKLRPSDETWDKLDLLLNYEEKNITYFNRSILGLSFFVLVLFGILLCSN